MKLLSYRYLFQYDFMAHCAVYCAPVHTTAPRSTCFSKKLQESKAEEKPDTLRNPMTLFFSSRIFVVEGQPPENYLNQQRCQQFGRVLSYHPGQTLMIYVQNIFHFVNSVPKVIFVKSKYFKNRS